MGFTRAERIDMAIAEPFKYSAIVAHEGMEFGVGQLIAGAKVKVSFKSQNFGGIRVKKESMQRNVGLFSKQTRRVVERVRDLSPVARSAINIEGDCKRKVGQSLKSLSEGGYVKRIGKEFGSTGYIYEITPKGLAWVTDNSA